MKLSTRAEYAPRMMVEIAQQTDGDSAVIGPVNIVECALRPETCRKSDDCRYRCIYLRINERITEVLSDLTLADLAAGKVPREGTTVLPR